MWNYEATVVRVVDGDTVDLNVDVGFRHYTVQRFRLNGYNAPELVGVEKPLGVQARARLIELLPAGLVVRVWTHKGDSFGRWLCDVALARTDIVPLLIAEGYGVRWDGRGARPVFSPLAPYPLQQGGA